MTNKQLTEHQVSGRLVRNEEGGVEYESNAETKARRAVEKMAHIQRAIENCYSDVRCAIQADERGENNGRILERVEHTLANVLTVIELEVEMNQTSK